MSSCEHIAECNSFTPSGACVTISHAGSPDVQALLASSSTLVVLATNLFRARCDAAVDLSSSSGKERQPMPVVSSDNCATHSDNRGKSSSFSVVQSPGWLSTRSCHASSWSANTEWKAMKAHVLIPMCHGGRHSKIRMINFKQRRTHLTVPLLPAASPDVVRSLTAARHPMSSRWPRCLKTWIDSRVSLDCAALGDRWVSSSTQQTPRRRWRRWRRWRRPFSSSFFLPERSRARSMMYWGRNRHHYMI